MLMQEVSKRQFCFLPLTFRIAGKRPVVIAAAVGIIGSCALFSLTSSPRADLEDQSQLRVAAWDKVYEAIEGTASDAAAV